MRKTIPVENLRYMYDNACVAHPERYVTSIGREAEVLEEHNQDLRGMARMLENVLHETGQYKGFGYIKRDGGFCDLIHPEFYEYRRKYF